MRVYNTQYSIQIAHSLSEMEMFFQNVENSKYKTIS